jgi:anti-sigma regulatory factor (Ser/Thr protein kinase)
VSADASILLIVNFSDNAVRVEVKDNGPGFDPPATPPPDDADAGWGLFLVEQLADAWGVGEGGKGVWFEIERGRGQDASGSESTSTAA